MAVIHGVFKRRNQAVRRLIAPGAPLLAGAALCASCGGPGWYLPPPPAPRETPGLYPGSASLPAEYPTYEEPTHLRNSSGTPTGQNRLAVSGPAAASGPWVERVEGSITTRPVLGGDGNLYVLAGGVMLVMSLDGTEVRRFNTDYGGGSLYWLDGQGVAYRNAFHELVCCSPVGERLWTYGAREGDDAFGNVARDWDSGGRLIVERQGGAEQGGDYGSLLACLNPDGTVAWSYEHRSGQVQSIQTAPDGGLFVLYWGGADALLRLEANGALRWKASPQLGPQFLKQRPDGGVEVDERAELIGGPSHTLGWVATRETFGPEGELLSRVLLYDDNYYGPTGETAETLDGEVIHGLPTNAPLLSAMPQYLETLASPSRDLVWGNYQARTQGQSLDFYEGGALRWSFGTAQVGLSAPVFDARGKAWVNAGTLDLFADPGARSAERHPAPALDRFFVNSTAIGPDGSRYVTDGWRIRKLAPDGSARAQWSRPSEYSRIGQMFCGPDGTVYAATLNSDGYNTESGIYALDKDLQLYWRYVDEYDIRRGITLAQDGGILFASENIRVEYHAPVSLPGASGRMPSYEVTQPPYGWQGGSLKCLGRDGALRWSLALGAPPAGRPVCGDGGAVYWIEGSSSLDWPAPPPGGTASGPRLRAADHSGGLKWERELPAPCRGILAQLAGGSLVLCLEDSNADRRYLPLWLAGHDPQTGAEQWRFRRDGFGFSACIADAQGRLYVSAQEYDEDDPVFVLDSAGSLLTTLEPPAAGTGNAAAQIALGPLGQLCLVSGDTLTVWGD